MQIFFLRPEPAKFGIYIEDSDKPISMRPRDILTTEDLVAEAEQPLVAQDDTGTERTGDEVYPDRKVNVFTAWCLPNVFLYASAFFCSKFAVYAIMYNLPEFLRDNYGADT